MSDLHAELIAAANRIAGPPPERRDAIAWLTQQSNYARIVRELKAYTQTVRAACVADMARFIQDSSGGSVGVSPITGALVTDAKHRENRDAGTAPKSVEYPTAPLECVQPCPHTGICDGCVPPMAEVQAILREASHD